MKKYFINKDGKEDGAFSFEDLKDLKIERNTMVWFNGLDKWMKAEHIEELKPLFDQMPPRLNTPPPISVLETPERLTPPQFTSSAISQNQSEIVQKSNKNMYFVLGMLAISILGIGAWIFKSNQGSKTEVMLNENITTQKNTEKQQKKYRKVSREEMAGKSILTSNGDKVNIRQTADLNATVLHQLDKGDGVVYLNEKSSYKTAVTVNGVERNNYWYKVQAIENADAIGWVHGDFLNLPENSSVENPNGKYTKNDLVGIWWTPQNTTTKIKFTEENTYIVEKGDDTGYTGSYIFKDNEVILVFKDRVKGTLKMSGGGRNSLVLTGGGETLVKE